MYDRCIIHNMNGNEVIYIKVALSLNTSVFVASLGHFFYATSIRDYKYCAHRVLICERLVTYLHDNTIGTQVYYGVGPYIRAIILITPFHDQKVSLDKSFPVKQNINWLMSVT